MLIECPACEGKRGREIIMNYNPKDGRPDGYWEPCEICNGEGCIDENQAEYRKR